MSAVIIRPEEPQDREAIQALLTDAFGGEAEAQLVDALRVAGDVVLSLVAERAGEVRGHILFSRLFVRDGYETFPAVALAPLAVHPDHQGEGIGTALVDEAHLRLERDGERLSVVLGDPAYYGRFGYDHERAAGFESAYQGEGLQALAWGEAPHTGRLDYAAAFADLG
ncbi:GNAT family N-acetyltransferase [Chelativorans salis]|uniref:N-acetyltransferase n=1 Tax=Chelativorans salis TaxID=2978478 RepID=A0ABT2LH65_9HYPH|nr:N-acetyltransferase [Chelativorans sp. EGI FJ00035]MCT7373881.1 N-acetyltransferase [Chelativorans sp. EGI FJ00035]